MSTIKQRLELAESKLRSRATPPDSPIQDEINRAVDTFSAGLPCPADVSPEIWQVIIDLDEEC